MMSLALVEAMGTVAAVLTTSSWIPQAWRTIRTRDTTGLSLPTYLALLIGNMLWLAYGVAIFSWPLIVANVIGVPLLAVIVTLKLRHG
jgi:MtN3 and saliva related transmembrane protein